MRGFFMRQRALTVDSGTYGALAQGYKRPVE